MTEEIFDDSSLDYDPLTDIVDYTKLVNGHSAFYDFLMKQFGVALLSDEEINKLGEPQSTWFRWGLGGFERAEKTYSVLKKFKNYEEGMRHLDIGCGPGYLSATYGQHGYESVGVDTGDLTHANCNKMDFPDSDLNYQNVDCATPEILELGKFDIITIDNVIEHVESPSMLMSNLKRVLNKNGIIYLIIPNSHSLDLVIRDPHYKLFGLSLLDKKDGDAMVKAANRNGTYEVNNWFFKYDLANYIAIFNKYGFDSFFLDEISSHEKDHRIEIFRNFNSIETRASFKNELSKLKQLLPKYLHEKLSYVVDIYLKELENDHAFANASDHNREAFIFNSFIVKYFLGSWFFVLKNGESNGKTLSQQEFGASVVHQSVMTAFQPYIVRKNVGGTEFNLFVGDEIGQLWYDTPSSDPLSEEQASRLPFIASRNGNIGWKEMEILRDNIMLPGSRVLECGCHHGVTTILMSGWVGPKGFVHAFDAVLNNVGIVKKNMALNGITNVAAFCAAIGGEFSIVQMHNESNVIVAKTGLDCVASTLMVKVSSFFANPPDVLKLDIEGAELAVLETEREFVKKIPRIAIEVHTDLLPPDGIARLLETLKDRDLYILWEDEGELRPYKNEPITERVHLFSW